MDNVVINGVSYVPAVNGCPKGQYVTKEEHDTICRLIRNEAAKWRVEAIKAADEIMRLSEKLNAQEDSKELIELTAKLNDDLEYMNDRYCNAVRMLNDVREELAATRDAFSNTLKQLEKTQAELEQTSRNYSNVNQRVDAFRTFADKVSSALYELRNDC